MYFKFNDEVHFYQTFIRNNLYILGNLIIIKEQLNINNKFFIDILAYDKNLKRIVILELKNIYTKSKVIGQVITYYDLLKKSNIEDIVEQFLNKNNINVSMCDVDCNPLVYIVVPDFDEQIIQNLNYVNIDNIKIFKVNAKQNKKCFEIIKEEYVPRDMEKNIQLKNEFNNERSLDTYFLSIDKKRLIKTILNYLSSKYNCKYFFLKNKISIFYNKKVLLYILIDKNVNLNLLINYNENIYRNMPYNNEIIKYKMLSKTIKLEVNSVPIKLINFIIEGE